VFRPNWFRRYHQKPNFLSGELLERLHSEICSSRYLAPTTLNSGFAGSLGFSVTFQLSALNQITSYLPSTVEYLKKILDPECNAFFLNPLVILESRSVDAHIDCSLRSWTRPEDPPFPLKVSVLYLEVPESVEAGGELLLYPFDWGPSAVVRPRPNLLVEFRGDLRHEVVPFTQKAPHPTAHPSNSGTRRVSLVCEQYILPVELLKRIPVHQLNSQCDFELFLENELQIGTIGNDAATRPASSDAT
jgi:hypothetical protein